MSKERCQRCGFRVRLAFVTQKRGMSLRQALSPVQPDGNGHSVGSETDQDADYTKILANGSARNTYGHHCLRAMPWRFAPLVWVFDCDQTAEIAIRMDCGNRSSWQSNTPAAMAKQCDSQHTKLGSAPTPLFIRNQAARISSRYNLDQIKLRIYQILAVEEATKENLNEGGDGKPLLSGKTLPG
jgi:hypothetical protein